MERGPLLEILTAMKGTGRELDLIICGEDDPVEIRNVVDVEELRSSNGIKITTEQNYIWLDASHVSLAYQARDDIEGVVPGID
ncbi:MAG: hypothetical protein ACR2GY_01970 [Phycisphaerales bacterium]